MSLTDLRYSIKITRYCLISQLNNRQFYITILIKEVIQPHLPIRLHCYDFVPLTPHN